MISTAVHLYSEFRLKPGAMPESRSDFEDFVTQTRAETGCAKADLFQRENDEELYILMAEFVDEEALGDHLNAAWRVALIETLRPLLDGEMTRFTMQQVI